MRHLGRRTCLLLLVLTAGCSLATHHDAPVKDRSPNDQTDHDSTNFVRDYAAVNSDSTINVVIEIPAGTTAKWEVMKPDGRLEWKIKDGRPRVVQYLGYPGNYGMVPRTLLSTEAGGDGDPLDAIVLGPAVDRGTVVRTKVIGVLKLLDGGEKDDKLLAVAEGTPLYRVGDLDELITEFPGVTTIIETWFVNYKGPGKMESLGFADRDAALAILDTARETFE